MNSVPAVLISYTNGHRDDIRTYVSGNGVYLYTSHGRRIFDGVAGSMNANLGHGNAPIATAMHEQALTLTAVPAIAGDITDSALRLASELGEPLGLTELGWQYLFTSSGSEATETALAAVWKYWSSTGHPRRRKILSLDHSYHGCTLGALAVTGRADEHTDVPVLVPNLRVALPAWDPRAPTRVSDALAQLLTRDGADELAAIFLEPVMGLAGMIPAAGSDIRRLVQLCRTNGILVVLDEALTGLGRTGRCTAAELYGVEPDILLVSKGLGCGFVPIAATCLAPTLASVLQQAPVTLRHGHTASGNPLATAVASTILDELTAHHVAANAQRMGSLLKRQLSTELAGSPGVQQLRATGLCIALETPSPEYAELVRRCAFDLGLRIRAIDANVILSPALTITTDECTELSALTAAAFHAVEKTWRQEP
ncbi:aminotransferase class III-fold pyridoxal phosphate-dependent enzyme [Nocardia nova]|uniref:aminotransferase class III-fold pyridoxal phosphate-dependent enzyme n=1 Tax=Nocardia nova TaxID=37330 RepID=UPI0018949BAC|nr:aminotransferase class III-fold pyridoxal phosphate-dependent enzyme [Nocardia nova]MBF6150342.1 aspartate aminotransferase family protein [Nocardia nova]